MFQSNNSGPQQGASGWRPKGAMAFKRTARAFRVLLLLLIIVELSLVNKVLAQAARWDSLRKVVRTLYQQGHYCRAIPLAQTALDVAKQTFGSRHPNTAKALSDLAQLYHAEGRYTNADSLYREILRIRKAFYGLAHPEVAKTLNELASVSQDEGKYDEADSLYHQALRLGLSLGGAESRDVATTLNDLATLYQSQKRYEEAESLYKRALRIHEKVSGKKDYVEIGQILCNMATLYDDRQQYAKAESLYQQGIATLQSVLGNGHPYVGLAMNNVADLDVVQGRYAQAESLYQLVLDIYKRSYGRNHLYVSGVVQSLGYLYMKESRIDRAVQFYVGALSIQKRVLGPENLEVIHTMNTLGTIYTEGGKYAEAESLFTLVLRTRVKVLGSSHVAVANVLNNLGNLYRKEGQYALAESLLTQALTVARNALGDDHPNVATVMENLALVHHDLGEYDDATRLYKEAIDIYRDSYARQSPELATALDNMAELYRDEGSYTQAATLYKEAFQIAGRVLGSQHPLVATILNNWANALLEPLISTGLFDSSEAQIADDAGVLADVVSDGAGSTSEQPVARHAIYAKAESLYCRTLRIRVKAFGPNHPDVANTLHSLAVLYAEKGQIARAESLFQKAIAIKEKSLGVDNFIVAPSLEGLATVYFIEGKYALAESLYERAIATWETTHGRLHPALSFILPKLARVWIAQGIPERSFALLARSFAIDQQTVSSVFSIAPERQKLAFLAAISSRYEMLLSLVLKKLRQDPTAVGTAFNAVLQRKGIALDALSREREALAASSDPRATRVMERLREVSTRLARLALAGGSDVTSASDRRQLEHLWALKDSLEEELASLSDAYASELRSRGANWQAVAQSLPPGSALIEFARTRMFDFGAKSFQVRWGPAHYLAFVLPSGLVPEPSLVDLGPADSIDQAVRDFRRRMALAPDQIAAMGERDAELLVRGSSIRLFQLVFAPLEKLLGQREILYIAPDGALNLIPFAALVDSSGDYLIDQYQINYLSCGRDLLGFASSPESGLGTYVIAAPDYDLSPGEYAAAVENVAASNVQLAESRSRNMPSANIRSVRWSLLPGTRHEAEAIAEIFPEAHVFQGKEALEEVVKGLRSPYRLHIATHGFFLPSKRKATTSRGSSSFGTFATLAQASASENPLLRSGLVFAGANRFAERASVQGLDDGILTALEVSSLSLWGTNLVVLSACETGVGDVLPGEGVFGLRRAFQLAGAKTVVMSLWKVSDEATQVLMSDFYRRLRDGEGKTKALQEAELDLKKAHMVRYGAAHPFYWAAFVSVGEP